MGDEQHRFYFAPGVRVVQRDENCLQFGVDSTRVGIIETTRPETLATSLHELPHVFNRKDFSIASHSAGLTQPAAHSLFDDLLAYGIIRPALSRPVIVLGTGFLATMLRNALTDADFLVRSPLPGEPEETYLSMQNAQDNNIPVLVVDRLAETTTMAPLLLAMARTWIPVSLIDATGVVGPIHINAMGPCPLCMELHRTDRDPTWHAATPRGTLRPKVCGHIRQVREAQRHQAAKQTKERKSPTAVCNTSPLQLRIPRSHTLS